MNIQAQKLELIDRILHSTDENKISMLNEAMGNYNNVKDENIDGDTLQKIYLEKISSALHDIQSGKIKLDKDVKKETDGW
jgi:quinolinate synthase